MSEQIDWVQRRHDCSIDLLFVRLRDQVEADVAARNELRSARGETLFKFRIDKEAEDNFRVFVEGHRVFIGVKFVKLEDAIAVHELKTDKLLFEATLTLNEQGDCRLKVLGKEKKELELWQFRMKALEDVFFGEALTQ